MIKVITLGNQAMAKRLTQKEVASRFKQRGFTLTGVYKNNYTPVEYTCSFGHNDAMRVSDFNKGGGCRTCSGRKQPTQVQVENLFRNSGHTLLSKYVTARSKLKYRCKNGHLSEVRWDCFQLCSSCPACNGQKRERHTQVEIEKIFSREGYAVVSAYTRSEDLLDVICPENHKHELSYKAFRRGVRCGQCRSNGFNISLVGSLYYVCFDHPASSRLLYKIGITNGTIRRRYAAEQTPYRILCEQRFRVGVDAFNLEQAILKKHRASRYVGPKLLEDGNTELFCRDVLGLDKGQTTPLSCFSFS